MDLSQSCGSGLRRGQGPPTTATRVIERFFYIGLLDMDRLNMPIVKKRTNKQKRLLLESGDRLSCRRRGRRAPDRPVDQFRPFFRLLEELRDGCTADRSR